MKPADFKAQIVQAHQRITPYIRKTPVISLSPGSFGIDAPLTLKLELLQHSGSFKARGAFNRLLSSPLPEAGVIAASGGNHGAAVAYAARRLGAQAEIFVPTICAPVKVARLKAYGAKVTQVGKDYYDALSHSEARARETKSLIVHAFDQSEVIAGQGTLAMEWAQQSPQLDTLLIAVGGGGLIGGIAAWHQGQCKIVSVEPERAPTLHTALDVQRPVEVAVGGIAADALGSRRVGDMMFPIAQAYVSQTVLVEEDSICLAQQRLWDELRVAAEPAGVVSLAALMSGRYRPQPGEHVGVLICGGNVALSSIEAEQPKKHS